MRFLCVDKPKSSFGLLPPEVQLQLMETSFAAIQQEREERKILELYYSPKGYSVVIVDIDSADEWVKLRGAIPVLNYMDTELYPLADGITSMKGMIESLKAIVK